MGCMRLAENTGLKKLAKNRHLGTIAQLLSGYIFATEARIDIQKKNLLSSNNVLQMSAQYGECRPTNG